MKAGKIPIDYHLHTKRCGHATGEIDSYVEQAIDLGLEEIGFSDHLPLLHTVDRSLTMSWDDLPFYLADVDRMRKKYPEINIKLGIEVDYLPKREKELLSILKDYDFDYIMGSVHFVDGWGIDDRRYIDNYDNYDIGDLYQRYFSLLRSAASSGLFDVLAHPDLIKKYNFRPEYDLIETYEATAESLASTGIAIEVSSAGLRKPAKEIYPSQEFLNACSARNIPIITGSDAHHPDEVGQNFDLLLQSIEAAGYNKLATFSKREINAISL